MPNGTTPTYGKDIKPLFREKDQKAMLKAFDLWSYDDVKANARPIYDEVATGHMPCDGPWPQSSIDMFKAWMDGGMPE